jgi:hypothetical protein
MLLSCGYDIIDIVGFSLRVSCPLPSLDTTHGGPHLSDAIQMFIEKHGILDVNPYVTMVTKLIRKRFGFVPTMKQLREITGRELIVVGSCLTGNDAVYISADTFPEMPCDTAIDISARIPILFTPILYGGHLYVDGGLCEHFPISLAKKGEKTLAIYTCGKPFGIVPTLSSVPIVRFFWILINAATKSKYSNLGSTDDVSLHVIRGKGGTLNVPPQEALMMFLCGLLNRKEPPCTNEGDSP